MYPVGSNGASQAILDARSSLPDLLVRAEHPLHALSASDVRAPADYAADGGSHETARLAPKLIVRVLDLAARRFKNIDDVLTYQQRLGYRAGICLDVLGFAPEPGQQAKP